MSGHGGARKGAGRKPGATSLAKRSLAEAAKGHAEKAVQTIVEVMNDPDASNKDRLSAANAILDRAYGKPIQYNENNNTHDAADPLRDLMREIASGSGRIGS